MKKRVVLLGSLPSVLPKNFRSDFLIYVDRDRKLGESSGKFISIGDNDSSTQKPEILLPRDKSRNDLYYALKLIPPKTKELHFIGFLGARRDHERMNFAEVHRYLKKQTGVSAYWWEDQKLKAMSLASGRYSFVWRGVFSLFCFQRTKVQLKGKCRYPLMKPTLLLPLSSHGLSNVGYGAFMVKTNAPLLVDFVS